jgi:hypothetical protein
MMPSVYMMEQLSRQSMRDAERRAQHDRLVSLAQRLGLRRRRRSATARLLDGLGPVGPRPQNARASS